MKGKVSLQSTVENKNTNESGLYCVDTLMLYTFESCFILKKNKQNSLELSLSLLLLPNASFTHQF